MTLNNLEIYKAGL